LETFADTPCVFVGDDGELGGHSVRRCAKGASVGANPRTAIAHLSDDKAARADDNDSEGGRRAARVGGNGDASDCIVGGGTRTMNGNRRIGCGVAIDPVGTPSTAQGIDGGPRGHLTGSVAPDAVGNGDKPWPVPGGWDDHECVLIGCATHAGAGHRRGGVPGGIRPCLNGNECAETVR
jgi:hypothetical protein